MESKRRRQIRLGIWGPACAVLLLTAGYYLAAPAVMRVLVRKAVQRAGWPVRSLEVDRVSWRRMRLSSIELGPAGEIRVESVTVRYGPRALWDGTLTRVRISGLHMHVPGVARFAATLPGTGGWKRMLPLLLRVRDLSIDSSSVVLSPRPDGPSIAFSGVLCEKPGGAASLRLAAPPLGTVTACLCMTETGSFRIRTAPLQWRREDAPADLIEKYAGLRMWGRIEMEGDVNAGGIPLCVSLSDAGFERGRTSASGVAGRIEWSDLQAGRTRGGQRVTIESLHVGDVAVTNSHVVFTLEGPGRLLVEDVSAYWGGGRFFCGAFRLVPAAGSMRVTVFCEHVDLAPLLQRLLDERIEGTGRLLGRVPLRLRWKPRLGLSLGSGFLYSEPGGGTLQVRDRHVVEQILASAAPSGDDAVRQAVRTKLVDALQDFAYDSFVIRVEEGKGGRPTGSVALKGRGRRENGLPVNLTLRFSTTLL